MAGNNIVKQGYMPASKTAYVISKEKPTGSNYDDSDRDVEGWARWGSDNNFPTMVREKLEKTSIANPVNYKLIGTIYGNGLKVFKRTYVDGKEVNTPFMSNDINEFFRVNDIQMFLAKQLVDYRWHMNTFCEFLFNNAKTKITRINHLDAEFCRLSIQNKKTNKIENVGFSATWDQANADNIVSIQKYDPYLADEFWKTCKHKVAFHNCFPTPGRIYYAFPFWGGIYRKNGWLDVANDIPEIINHLHQNQISIKYHIKVPYSYWEGRYTEWNTYTEEKQDKKIAEKLAEIDKFLTSKENAGKSFVSHYMTDPMTGKEVSGWSIESVEDKLDKSAYIPNSEKADEQITQALGYSTSLLGLKSGTGQMGAGSGSDKREAFNTSIAVSKLERDILLKPLYLIRDVNGWGNDIQFAFSHEERQTLDTNPTGGKNLL